MIAAGSSLRGLSEVTIARSARSAAIRPISGRFAAVAVAAAAEDAEHAAGRQVARGAQHVLERAGLVRVVDDDGERLALVDGLEAAGDALDAGHALGDRLVGDVEQQRDGDRAEDVLDVEAAAQPRLELDSARAEASALERRRAGSRRRPRSRT